MKKKNFMQELFQKTAGHLKDSYLELDQKIDQGFDQLDKLLKKNEKIINGVICGLLVSVIPMRCAYDKFLDQEKTVSQTNVGVEVKEMKKPKVLGWLDHDNGEGEHILVKVDSDMVKDIADQLNLDNDARRDLSIRTHIPFKYLALPGTEEEKDAFTVPELNQVDEMQR